MPRRKNPSPKRNPPNTSRSSTDDYEKEFFLHKLKKARREFERNKQILQEYREKYFCEQSPFDQHKFVPFQPFVGCAKKVCRFCAEESPNANFQQSVYAHKGKRFGSEKKTRQGRKKK